MVSMRNLLILELDQTGTGLHLSSCAVKSTFMFQVNRVSNINSVYCHNVNPSKSQATKIPTHVLLGSQAQYPSFMQDQIHYYQNSGAM